MNQHHSDDAPTDRANTARAPRVNAALVVGLGAAGVKHLAALRTLAVPHLLVCTTGRSTQPNLGAALAGVHIEHDLDAALAHRPDLVVVATPPAFHAEQAVRAARTGAHLLIESPLAHTLDRLSELQSLADEQRLTVMVAMRQRFHPLVRTLKRWLDAGRLGAPLHAHAEMAEHLPTRRPWEDYRASCAASEQLGGGVIRTFLGAIDLLAYLLGPLTHAHATIRTCETLETSTADDAATLALTHAGDVMSTAALDFVRRPRTHELHVVGEDAAARLDLDANSLDLIPATGAPERASVPVGWTRDSLVLDQMAHLLRRIDEGSRLTDASLAGAVSVLSHILPARQAAIGRRSPMADAVRRTHDGSPPLRLPELAA